MLPWIDVMFIFDSVPLGLSSFANILQIAGITLRVVRHFFFHNQNNSTSSPGVLG